MQLALIEIREQSRTLSEAISHLAGTMFKKKISSS